MKNKLSPEYQKMLSRPEAEQYEALNKRCDNLLQEARVLLAEAYRSRDQATIKQMTAVIREVERQKTEMRKPKS